MAIRSALAALVVIATAGLPVGAPRAESPGDEVPPVAIDRLLQLPDSLDYGVERRGGATRSEWLSRFRSALASRANARAALANAQAELAEVASDTTAWQLNAPGMGNVDPDAPLSYQLRQEIRRQQAELARAEVRLRELEIEANLSGVPESWRLPITDLAPANDSVTPGGPPG